MSEYEKLKNYATEKGWTIENCSGDHVKFIPPAKLNVNGYVTVNRSLSTNNRSFKNMLAQFRKFDKDFYRTRQKKQKTTEPDMDRNNVSVSENIKETVTQKTETYMKPKDKTIYKKYSWLQIGTKVRKRDEIELEPLEVVEIHSADKKRVWEETDIIIIKGGKEKEIMAGDLDAWETRRCQICGKDRPVNYFNLSAKSAKKQFFCTDCQTDRQSSTQPPVLLEKNKNEDSVKHFIDETLAKLTSKVNIETLMNEIFRRLSPDAQTTLLSYYDPATLLSVITDHGLRTDIGLYENDEFVDEMKRRDIVPSFHFTDKWTIDSTTPQFRIQLLSVIKDYILFETSSDKNEERAKDSFIKELICELPPSTTKFFTDKDLYDELKRRGWEGKLTKTLTME